jgi:hypothetical protein
MKVGRRISTQAQVKAAKLGSCRNVPQFFDESDG